MKDDKRLKRRVRNSYIISTTSIALVLFLLGSVSYLMVTAMNVARSLQESVVATVELKRGIDDDRKEDIRKAIEKNPLAAEVRYISKEEKVEDREFSKMFGDEFKDILADNPLLDSYEVRLSTEAADTVALDKFVATIFNCRGVERVSCPVVLIEKLHSTVNKIRLVLTLFGGALLLISLILLNNTIRLVIFSRRHLINTMKLVGATKWFIMQPFIVSALRQGLIAGGVASVLFCAATYSLNEAVPELTSLAELFKVGMIILSMILGGVVISVTFTVVAVNKFVNMKSNKIYIY